MRICYNVHSETERQPKPGNGDYDQNLVIVPFREPLLFVIRLIRVRPSCHTRYGSIITVQVTVRTIVSHCRDDGREE